MLERARFAPSPTGPLHIGGVRTALFNYLIAKKNGGEFILRIEDTDTKRTVEGAEKHIIDSLRWLGLEFDEGPVRQSNREALYKKSVSTLIEKGLAYYAFDTPSDLDKARGDSKGTFKYNFTSRMKMSNSFTLGADETKARLKRGGYSVRMVVPEKITIKAVDEVRGNLSFNSEELEDKIILKSDGMPTYHLANVVDDHDMKITSVIRGEEWLSSLPSHILLYEHFGWTPPKFYHLPLILKSSGAGKLSKRDAEEQGHPVFAIKWEDSLGFKEAGFTSEGLINYLALLGWNNSSDREKYSLLELIDEFNDVGINKSGARFDPEKNEWFNHSHIQKTGGEQITSRLKKDFFDFVSKGDDIRLDKITELIKPRLNSLNDVFNASRFFFENPENYSEKHFKKFKKSNYKEILEGIVTQIDSTNGLNEFKPSLEKLVLKNEWNFGKVMGLLRLSLVGELSGPPPPAPPRLRPRAAAAALGP